MKKLLLSLGAVALAMGASAAPVNNLLPAAASNFNTGELYQYEVGGNYYGWGMYAQSGNEMGLSVAEGGYNSEYCLDIENETAGEQLYYSQAFYTWDDPYGAGTYTFRFYAKTDVEGGAPIQVQYYNSVSNAGGGWTNLNLTNEWAQYEVNFTISEAMDRVVFNVGQKIGNYYFDNIEFGEPNIPTTVPSNADIVGTFYGEGFPGETGEHSFWAWSNEHFEGGSNANVEEDGFNCFQYIGNGEGSNWYYQASLHHLALEAGTEYYVNLKVKGTPFTGISAFFGDSSSTNLSSFDVTAEWTYVTIFGTPVSDINGEGNSIIINLGNYAGTLYITDVTVFSLPEGSDVDPEPEPEPSNFAGVYTIEGYCYDYLNENNTGYKTFTFEINEQNQLLYFDNYDLEDMIDQGKAIYGTIEGNAFTFTSEAADGMLYLSSSDFLGRGAAIGVSDTEPTFTGLVLTVDGEDATFPSFRVWRNINNAWSIRESWADVDAYVGDTTTEDPEPEPEGPDYSGTYTVTGLHTVYTNGVAGEPFEDTFVMTMAPDSWGVGYEFSKFAGYDVPFDEDWEEYSFFIYAKEGSENVFYVDDYYNILSITNSNVVLVSGPGDEFDIENLPVFSFTSENSGTIGDFTVWNAAIVDDMPEPDAILHAWENLTFAEGTGNVKVDKLDNENAPVEYYSIQGVKVLNPNNGIYIVKQGDKTRKVVIRK